MNYIIMCEYKYTLPPVFICLCMSFAFYSSVSCCHGQNLNVQTFLSCVRPLTDNILVSNEHSQIESEKKYPRVFIN